MLTIHQIIVGASSRDAITNMSLGIRDQIRKTYESNVYSYHEPDASVNGEVRRIGELPSGSSTDVLIYHASFGIPDLTRILTQRPERLVLVYHNITPSKFFTESDPLFASQLEWGRTELEILRDRFSLVIADSPYNAHELELLGYQNVHVSPMGVNPRRLNSCPTNKHLLTELMSHFPNGYVLVVSQVLQHKRIDLAIEAIHLLRSVWDLDVGLVVAGPLRKAMYLRDINVLRDRLPESHVLFTGELSESELATVYRASSVFLSASDHEGLALPPLEAMAAQVPVVARASGAVPNTVGEGGILVPVDAGVGEIASTLARVIKDQKLRSILIYRGMQRIHEFTSFNWFEPFEAQLQELTR